MTNKNEMFARIFAPYGSPWRLIGHHSSDTQGIEEIRNIFNYCISIQNRAIGPHGYIHFDFLNNRNFNACATTDGQYDFVAIFSGVVNQLYRLFFAFLSDPLVLPSFGDTKNQVVLPETIEAIKAGITDHTRFQHPNDDGRYRAAQNFSLISCILLLNHEIGHIANCHPYLLLEKFGVLGFEEMLTTTSSAIPDDFKRACEWEADEYSGCVTFIFLNHFRPALDGIRDLSMDYIISASSFMLFLYINLLSGTDSNAETATHPCPRDRWRWMTHQILSSDRCKPYNPDPTKMSLGVRDVAAFWARNNLGNNIGIQDEIEDKRTESRFDSARKILMAHDLELRAIQTKRDEMGRLWLSNNRAEAMRFRSEVLQSIASGAVGRPKELERISKIVPG